VNQSLKNALIKTGLYHPLKQRLYRNSAYIGIRNRKQRNFYATILKAGDLIFDVGANVGQRTAIFASLGCRVIAFEPDRRAVAELQPRFRFSRKVTIEPVALGDVEGEMDLYCCALPQLSSLSTTHVNETCRQVFPNHTWQKSDTVSVETLDNMIGRHGLPAFIKIDAEGYDANVLQGLSTPVSLSFEYHGTAIEEAFRCARRLHDLKPSYRFNYCLGETLDCVLPEHVSYAALTTEVLRRIDKPTWGDVYAFI
jgi:FkbM family methyltransferase